MINLLCAIRTLSPLHCGVGIGMNDIDLPVARHKVSGQPLIPGSSIKGVLKDEYRAHQDQEGLAALFGADNTDGSDGKAFASALSMGDATLLALPVRSYFGTFAYLASPYTLLQFKSAMARIDPGQEFPPVPTGLGLQNKSDAYRVMLTRDTLLKSPEADANVVLLEELDLLVDGAEADEWGKKIADHYFDTDEEKVLFKKRFAIADDNALNFLCETALPVEARIAIDQETGTVKQGALWYEETVPPETLFFAVTGVDRSFKNGVNKTAPELSELLVPDGERSEIFTQLGGKATTGRGFVTVRFLKGGA